MWVGEYNTYERAIGARRPVLSHLFFADTRLGVLASAATHKISDGFFRGCTNNGRYGQIECWTESKTYESSVPMLPAKTGRWIGEFNTYENIVGTHRPVLTHLLYGDTREEAVRVINAHKKSDGFFAGCTDKGQYFLLDCWTEWRIYQR